MTKKLRISQFIFVVSDEGGGEHAIMDMGKSLKAVIYTFRDLVRKRNYNELADDVEKVLLGKLANVKAKW